MNMTMEFIISLVVQLLILAFFFGIYVSTIRFMKEQIADLKSDMKKYNNVLERLIITEQSVRSAHHRIDEIKEENYENRHERD